MLTPLDRTPRFPPTLLHKYPHMAPADVAIWERFLSAHAPNFLGFDYDVRLGGSVPLDPALPQYIKDAARLLSAKRIDAVGHKANVHWIIEVKPTATLTALGQVLGYSILYAQAHKPPIPVIPTIVCEALDPDLPPAFDRFHVQVIKV